MTDARARRQRMIAELIRTDHLASQEEVTERLAAMGHNVTQATVSRDLDQLGAVKVKQSGALRYALPDQIGESDWSVERVERILREWVMSVEAAGNLVVMKTPPGSAHLVAAAIDHAAMPEIAGTVSGDDTLFVAVRDDVSIYQVASRFRTMAGR